VSALTLERCWWRPPSHVGLVVGNIIVAGFYRDAADLLASSTPTAERDDTPNQEHVLDAATAAPVLRRFFNGE
jgi:hypothetical protein